MASLMVEASTSTTSSLLVSLRNGVGIRTFFAIDLVLGSWGGKILSGEQRLEFTQTRLDLLRLARMAVDGIERFQTISCDTKHHGILGRNLPGGNEFFRYAHCDAACRLGENTFALSKQFDRFPDFIIRHIFRAAAGFLHGA